MKTEDVIYQIDWYFQSDRRERAQRHGVYYTQATANVGTIRVNDGTYDTVCDFYLQRALSEEEIEAMLGVVRCRLGAES